MVPMSTLLPLGLFLASATAMATFPSTAQSRTLPVNGGAGAMSEGVPLQDDGVPKAGEAEPDEPTRVTGQVRFKGEIPTPKPLKVAAKQAAGCCPADQSVDATDRALLIDEKGGIANAVVTVTVEGAKRELPKAPLEMDQRGCRFEPHVLVVPKGAKVSYLNSDSTSHNVHLISLLNDPLNQTVPAGSRITREAKHAESIKVTCDMHTWMSAWVVVTEATHWAVSGPDGRFELAGLPAGKHRVQLWHETLGKRTGSVTVAEDGSAEPMLFELAPKKKKSRRRRR